MVGNYEDLLDAAMKSLEDCSDLQLHRCAEIHGVVDGVGWEDFQIFQSGDVRIFSL